MDMDIGSSDALLVDMLVTVDVIVHPNVVVCAKVPASMVAVSMLRSRQLRCFLTVSGGRNSVLLL